jgi:hypothetical protein
LIFGLFIGLAGLTSVGAAIRTDAGAAKAIEDQMYKARVDGRMIKPDEHKRTEGRHSNAERGPEPIIPQAVAGGQ